MRKGKIAIRCIASNKKGFGNFNRALLISEQLRKKKYQILFIIDNNSKVINELINRKFKYIILPKFKSINKESLFIINSLNIKKIESIILDSRERGEGLSKKIYGHNIRIFLLDDAWVNEAWADIIVNGTMIKEYQAYKKFNKNSKIFIGTKYFILDENFLNHKKSSITIKNKKEYVVIISMGGSDLHGLSFKILDSISKIDNILIKVIMGPLMKEDIKINKYKKENILFIKSSKSIWNEFKDADLIISNAGNTLFELATQKIPTICIPVIEHQIPYAEFFHKKGFSINLGFWKNLKNDEIKNTVIKILKNPVKRKKMVSNGNKIIDGKGLSRVIKILDSFLKIK